MHRCEYGARHNGDSRAGGHTSHNRVIRLQFKYSLGYDITRR
jgi:hypothetical protein